MRGKCLVQTRNFAYKNELPDMKKKSLVILKIFRNFHFKQLDGQRQKRAK